MKDTHIIEVLDNAPVESLSESHLNEIRAHAEACASCRNAYEAARISGVVLRSRAQATIEPSPFFQTRVMAALREQQAVENVPAMFRLWKSARALVSSLAVTTAALAALSFIVPAPVTSVVDQTASADSAESVILGQSNDELTYEQVLSTIYDDDDEAR